MLYPKELMGFFLLFLGTLLANGQDNPRKSFAYTATLRTLDPTDSPSVQDRHIAAIYLPRRMVKLSLYTSSNSKGQLALFSDTEGFFTLDLTTTKKIDPVPLTIPGLLTHATFQSSAVSQSQFKNQKLDSVVDNFGFGIITFMTSGHSYDVPISQPEFLDLVKKCPPDGSIRHFVEDKYTPTELIIAKIGTKISSIQIKNRKEESTGVFDLPIDDLEDSWTATLTIQSDSNPQNENLPQTRTIKLEKTRTIVSEMEIEAIYQQILAAIPAKTMLLRHPDDGPLDLEWGSRGFRPVAAPEGNPVPGGQKFIRQNGLFRYFAAAGVLALALFGMFFWKFRNAWLVIGLGLLGVNGEAHAQGKTPYPPHSGLYCVTAGAAAMGRTIEFETIRTANYLTAPYGSTQEDLVRALALGNLQGIPRSYLTPAQLCCSDHPVLLHIRQPGSTNFRSWALFLGITENGGVSLYDPPFPQREIDLGELLAVWDGTGIEIRDPETKVFPLIPWDWILALLGAGGAYFLFRFRLSPRLSVFGATLILAVISGFSSQGLGRSPEGRGIITAHFFPHIIPEMDNEEVREAWKNGSCYLIDSRDYGSNLRSHIPGSYSLPVNAGISSLVGIVERIPKDSLLVCLCAGPNCAWSENVGNQLIHLGYRKVFIYRGGMEDWKEHNLPVEK